MTDLNFAIVFSIIMVSLMLILMLSIKLQFTVKAGSVSKYCRRYAVSSYNASPKAVLDDKVVDISDLTSFRVCGNSMKDSNICSGNTVYVSVYQSELEKEQIDTYPVMVITINDPKPWDSMYKLRKFVCYVDLKNTDWHKVYNDHNDRIKVEEELFVKGCSRKKERKELQGLDKCILSETFDEYASEYKYSLHPIANLYGKVCYVRS